MLPFKFYIYIYIYFNLQRDPETKEEQDLIDHFRNTHYNEKDGWVSDAAQDKYVSIILYIIYFVIIMSVFLVIYYFDCLFFVE